MKKGFALVMASMMALSLTACGGNGSSATTAADTSAADTKAEGTTDLEVCWQDRSVI